MTIKNQSDKELAAAQPLDLLADTKMTASTYVTVTNTLHYCRDALTGRGYFGAQLAAKGHGEFAMSRAYSEGRPYTFLATKWAYRAWQAARAASPASQPVAPETTSERIRRIAESGDKQLIDDVVCGRISIKAAAEKLSGERDVRPTPTSAADAKDAALRKINDIRNSIIGLQALNWSEHVYPLVAALDEARYEGMEYPDARAYYGTLLERAVKAEDALAAMAAAPSSAAGKEGGE